MVEGLMVVLILVFSFVFFDKLTFKVDTPKQDALEGCRPQLLLPESNPGDLEVD